MTPQYLPGLQLSTLRKKPRSAQQKLIDQLKKIKQKSLSQLGECFRQYIPSTMLKQSNNGTMSRRRIFSFENTFWMFFSQVLDADGGCQEAVRKIQAHACRKSLPQPSSSTAAYCKARAKLQLENLQTIYQHTSQYLSEQASSGHLNGRRVIVVDGSGISMPDTEENQSKWPQQANQKPGCGFPQAALCVCFNLHTGIALSHELGNKKSAELPMLRQQSDTFKEDDIFLGDKGFCSYYDQSIMRENKIDSVITLARRKPVKASDAIEILGENDLIIEWKKPKWNKNHSYSRMDWEALPECLQLRQIKVTVNEPGFRTTSFHIITTLLDARSYSADALADLYYQRWQVELFFRDIKTSMGMDILRCKSPDMIHKEILMYFIVYNCIRRLIMESAIQYDVSHSRVSFKACLQALRQWIACWIPGKDSRLESNRLMSELKSCIADKIVPLRSGRSEPRAVKRRPKNYQLLNKPRHEMKEIQHRSKYRAEAA